MNRKQLIILLALVAVLGGASLVLMNRNQEASSYADSKMGQKLLQKIDINDVAQIHMIGDGELTLHKKDGIWSVKERGDYPANFTEISGFLLKLVDLKITQSEPVEPAQLGELTLVEPKPGEKSGPKTASMIELIDSKGKVMTSVLLGLKHTRKTMRYGNEVESPDGRYVLLKSDPKTALLISDPLGNSDPKPDYWLIKDFVKIEKTKSIEFTALESTNSWKLEAASTTNKLTLLNVQTNEMPDAGKISAIGSTLGSLSFLDVATNSAATGLDKPLVVKVDTFDNFHYVLKIGKKNAENNYYLTVGVSADLPKERVAGKDEKPEEKTKLDKEFADNLKKMTDKLEQEKKLEKWIYLVSSYSVDPVIRGRAQLMKDKKDDKAKDKMQPPTESDEENGDAAGAPMNLQPPPEQ